MYQGLWSRTLNRISLNELKEVLHYEPKTGIWTWLKRISIRITVGKSAGSGKKDDYVRIRIYNQNYQAHVLAWFYMTGEWPKKLIDHKDKKKDNNIWDNLRAASKKENAGNTKMFKTNTSGYRGVYFNKINKNWNVSITIARIKVNQGTYDCKHKAAHAYNVAALNHFGEFAFLNVIENAHAASY